MKNATLTLLSEQSKALKVHRLRAANQSDSSKDRKIPEYSHAFCTVPSSVDLTEMRSCGSCMHADEFQRTLT